MAGLQQTVGEQCQKIRKGIDAKRRAAGRELLAAFVTLVGKDMKREKERYHRT